MGAAVSAGLSFATNAIENAVHAFVENTVVNSSGKLDVIASSSPTIDAHAIGGAAAVAVGSNALSLSVGGATTNNAISGSVEAKIQAVKTANTQTPTTQVNAKNVTVKATEKAIIKSDAKAASALSLIPI